MFSSICLIPFKKKKRDVLCVVKINFTNYMFKYYLNFKYRLHWSCLHCIPININDNSKEYVTFVSSGKSTNSFNQTWIRCFYFVFWTISIILLILKMFDGFVFIDQIPCNDTETDVSFFQIFPIDELKKSFAQDKMLFARCLSFIYTLVHLI